MPALETNDMTSVREKILIVDDDEGTRRRLGTVLAKEGLNPLSAADGAQALDIIERERPEIILTDLRMPNIDGMELLHSVKSSAPLTQVILMTAHGDDDLAIHALRGGALDYLRKPIDLDQLLISIGRARENLSRHRSEQPLPTIP